MFGGKLGSLGEEGSFSPPSAIMIALSGFYSGFYCLYLPNQPQHNLITGEKP